LRRVKELIQEGYTASGDLHAIGRACRANET